jgi:hypothetical protein
MQLHYRLVQLARTRRRALCLSIVERLEGSSRGDQPPWPTEVGLKRKRGDWKFPVRALLSIGRAMEGNKRVPSSQGLSVRPTSATPSSVMGYGQKEQACRLLGCVPNAHRDLPSVADQHSTRGAKESYSRKGWNDPETGYITCRSWAVIRLNFRRN